MGRHSPLTIDPCRPGRAAHTQHRNVSPGYSETLGIRLVAGLRSRPGPQRLEPCYRSAAEVQRIWRAFAVRQGGVMHRVWRRVVGVVGDTNYRASIAGRGDDLTSRSTVSDGRPSSSARASRERSSPRSSAASVSSSRVRPCFQTVRWPTLVRVFADERYKAGSCRCSRDGGFSRGRALRCALRGAASRTREIVIASHSAARPLVWGPRLRRDERRGVRLI